MEKSVDKKKLKELINQATGDLIFEELIYQEGKKLKIEVKEEEATNEYKYFKITRGEPYEELGERIDVAGKLLYKMLEKQDKMLEKQDQMLGKQDQTIGAINLNRLISFAFNGTKRKKDCLISHFSTVSLYGPAYFGKNTEV